MAREPAKIHKQCLLDFRSRSQSVNVKRVKIFTELVAADTNEMYKDSGWRLHQHKSLLSGRSLGLFPRNYFVLFALLRDLWKLL